MKPFLLSLALTAAIISTASGQSVAGTWDAGMNTPGGSSAFKILFQQRGDSVTGTVYRSSGEVPLAGTMKGDTLRFAYLISYNENSIRVAMVARVAGDSMVGFVEFNGAAQDAFWARRQKSGGPSVDADGGMRPLRKEDRLH
jgi:hypothetical protein